MSWLSVAVGGSALIGAGASWLASGKQADAAQQSLDFQKQTYATQQGQIKPYLGLGNNAVGTINSLYGYGGPAGSKAPDFSAFAKSPDYNFAFDQGLSATKNQLGAGGSLQGGAGAAALTNFGQGLASQQYGNYFARLMGMAGMGASAAGASMNSSTAMAGNIGNTYGGLGMANASGYLGVGNAANSAVGNYASLNMMSKFGQQPQVPGASSYFPNANAGYNVTGNAAGMVSN